MQNYFSYCKNGALGAWLTLCCKTGPYNLFTFSVAPSMISVSKKCGVPIAYGSPTIIALLWGA